MIRQLRMRTASEYALLMAIVVGVVFALWMATVLPHGELWVVTLVSSVFAYKACTKLGWLALVLIPFFPFLLFVVELDRQESERYPFGIAIATWSVFAFAAAVGAWRWWKRLRDAAADT